MLAYQEVAHEMASSFLGCDNAGNACTAYQAGLAVNSTVKRRLVAVLLWWLKRSAKEKVRVCSPRTGIGKVSVRFSLLLRTGSRCCSPSLKLPPSAIIRHPRTSYLSVTVNRKSTPTVCPGPTLNFFCWVDITWSVIGLKSTSFTVPDMLLPVRLLTEAAMEVWSPTRTNRGRFGVSINSLLVTAVAFIWPVIIFCVWA